MLNQSTGNNVAFNIYLPKNWAESVFNPASYVSFIDSFFRGKGEQPIHGVVIFCEPDKASMPDIIEFIEYLSGLKFIDGVAVIDCNGSNLKDSSRRLESYNPIQRCGFKIQNVNEKGIENIQYSLDRMVLEKGDADDLTAYSVYHPGNIQDIENIFQFLQEYKITSHVLVIDGEKDSDQFTQLLAYKNEIFDELIHIRKLSKQYGVEYLACEDNFNIFTDRYQETDIIFYHLFGGARVDLMADGRVIILGGKHPYDAGIWQPDQNAFDLVIQTLKDNRDFLWHRLSQGQMPTNGNSSTKLLSAVMAGQYSEQDIQRA